MDISEWVEMPNFIPELGKTELVAGSVLTE